MSLADLYNEIASYDEDVEADIEKMAAQEVFEEMARQEDDDEAIKLAAEYDAAGRIMARSYFDEMLKAAAEMAAENEKEEEEKEKEEEEKEEDKEKKKKALPPALQAALAEKKAALVSYLQENPEQAQALYDHYFGK